MEQLSATLAIENMERDQRDFQLDLARNMDDGNVENDFDMTSDDVVFIVSSHYPFENREISSNNVMYMMDESESESDIDESDAETESPPLFELVEANTQAFCRGHKLPPLDTFHLLEMSRFYTGGDPDRRAFNGENYDLSNLLGHCTTVSQQWSLRLLGKLTSWLNCVPLVSGIIEVYEMDNLFSDGLPLLATVLQRYAQFIDLQPALTRLITCADIFSTAFTTTPLLAVHPSFWDIVPANDHKHPLDLDRDMLSASLDCHMENLEFLTLTLHEVSTHLNTFLCASQKLDAPERVPLLRRVLRNVDALDLALHPWYRMPDEISPLGPRLLGPIAMKFRETISRCMENPRDFF
jgi:hypothetical protein